MCGCKFFFLWIIFSGSNLRWVNLFDQLAGKPAFLLSSAFSVFYITLRFSKLRAVSIQDIDLFTNVDKVLFKPNSKLSFVIGQFLMVLANTHLPSQRWLCIKWMCKVQFSTCHWTISPRSPTSISSCEECWEFQSNDTRTAILFSPLLYAVFVSSWQDLFTSLLSQDG